MHALNMHPQTEGGKKEYLPLYLCLCVRPGVCFFVLTQGHEKENKSDVFLYHDDNKSEVGPRVINVERVMEAKK